MQALAEGPRAADQFASVTAVLFSLVASAVPAQDLLAKWLHSLAEALEVARQDNDSIAASNIIRVVSHLYLCKVVGVLPSVFCARICCVAAGTNYANGQNLIEDFLQNMGPILRTTFKGGCVVPVSE